MAFLPFFTEKTEAIGHDGLCCGTSFSLLYLASHHPPHKPLSFFLLLSEEVRPSSYSRLVPQLVLGPQPLCFFSFFPMSPMSVSQNWIHVFSQEIHSSLPHHHPTLFKKNKNQNKSFDLIHLPFLTFTLLIQAFPSLSFTL